MKAKTTMSFFICSARFHIKNLRRKDGSKYPFAQLERRNDGKIPSKRMERHGAKQRCCRRICRKKTGITIEHAYAQQQPNDTCSTYMGRKQKRLPKRGGAIEKRLKESPKAKITD
ncbi:MAG: hypothetical protein ACLUKN_07130 [Bacilli bacterium]